MANLCTRCLLRPQSSLLRALIKKPISIPSRSQPTRHRARGYATPSSSPSPASPPSDFRSLADLPPRLVKANAQRRHGPGLIILALIPLTAFALGTWQVYRLEWKSDLIARFEDRLVRDPLPLPLAIDPDAVKDFDYRRVFARGVWRHDLEMLIGPRMREGQNGYLVVTPLERSDPKANGGNGSKTRVLVCRGWIRKDLAEQRKRANADARALPKGEVVVQGLLREAWKKNMFTPENRPERGDWFFPDVQQMAAVSESQPVWVEETMVPDLVEAYDREEKGIPIGRPAEVNLRNNHAQYIFTWYSLSAATTIMLWMVIRKPPSSIASKVRQSRDWA